MRDRLAVFEPGLLAPLFDAVSCLWGTCDCWLYRWKNEALYGINVHALQQARDGAHHTFEDGKWVYTRFFVC